MMSPTRTPSPRHNNKGSRPPAVVRLIPDVPVLLPELVVARLVEEEREEARDVLRRVESIDGYRGGGAPRRRRFGEPGKIIADREGVVRVLDLCRGSTSEWRMRPLDT